MKQNYSKQNPYYASLKERYSLCNEGSQKNTQHIVLDLKGSGIVYNVGDSIAIFPENDPNLVDQTLAALKTNGEEWVTSRKSEKKEENGNNSAGIIQERWTLREFFLKKANITTIPKKLLTHFCHHEPDALKKNHLENLLKSENKEALTIYLEQREVWDLLTDHPDVSISSQELCNFLQPLLPRFYSISSSMKQVGEEVHLTVAQLSYYANNSLRRGVCSHYLCNLIPFNQSMVPLYLQASNGFTLPKDPNSSIIMIGPGTGIAPFRAFLQERIVTDAPGKNWLFFGERGRMQEYYYQDYWEDLVLKGKLRIDTAFSRDQKEKIYVQHRMLEQSKELFRWLEEGAYLYVCGDAHRMAKDVDATLHQIVMQEGNLAETEAKAYIKHLRLEKRYLRDVY